MNAKRYLAIPFFITVAIYSLVLYQNMQAYEEWKTAELEKYPPETRPYVDFYPYMSSQPGQLMIISGLIILLGWLIAIILLEPALSKRKQISQK